MADPFEQVVERLMGFWRPLGAGRSVLRDSKLRYEAESTVRFLLDTGLLKLVEERPDPACSDSNCSYRAEVSLLADECQGSGCRRRGDQPEVPWTDDDLTSPEEAERNTHSESKARELRQQARELGVGDQPEGEPSEEFVVCYAAGYPNPYFPHPNTRENAHRFADQHRGPGYSAEVRRRLKTEWVLDHPQDREAK